MLGDLLGGFLGLLMAGCGFYATTPGGTSWLPTYTVVSFINGSVGLLGLMEKMAFSRFPLFSFYNPLVINVVGGRIWRYVASVAC